MAVACEVVNEIVKNEDYNQKLGLKVSNISLRREWTKYNFLIGENGAGKSRFLKMIKDNAPEDCLVIHMDFSALDFQEESDPHEYVLVNEIIFGSESKQDYLRDFVKVINGQMLSFFEEIEVLVGRTATKQKAVNIISELNPNLKNIMNREITVNQENKICLKKGENEKRIVDEWKMLSPGERNILIIVIAELIIAMLGKPCILLIDELETHLHPSAQIEALQLIQKGLKERDHCTCIASHSIFLLPYFSIREVVYLNNGAIQKVNGKLYQQIYNNLVGIDENESLSEFLKSVADWQYAEYLAECFVEPLVVDKARSDDPQACQLKKVLESFYRDRDMINILDFGAGSGRIAECIDLMLLDKNNETLKALCEKMQYHIYDKYKISPKFDVNQGWRGKAYTSKEKIKNDMGSFDILVLFNVLHEIEINEWKAELNFMLELLKDDGVLLFGERRILSLGEKPYGNSGYLVLGDEELEKLFPDFERERIELSDAVDQVTICYAIKKKRGKTVTVQNVRNAVAALEKNSKSKIKEIKKKILDNGEPRKKGETIDARGYAFYCQQYVNAQEALELLKKMVHENTDETKTLADIRMLGLPWSCEKKLIEELAKRDTVEGRKAKKFIMERMEENR